MTDFDIIKYELNNAKFQLHKKHCWVINLPDGIKKTVKVDIDTKVSNVICHLPPDLINYSDTQKNPIGSCATLFDNDIEVVNKHDKIEDIINNGTGRYRLWENKLYLSTKDNSSPKEANHKYHIVIFPKNGINDDNYNFGNNWLDLTKTHINELSVTNAIKHVETWFPNIANKSIVDIGCGSGLISLSFIKKLPNNVVSFDSDVNCIEATESLAKAHYNDVPPNWAIKQGSILDDKFIAQIGQFDIVYYWGIHTEDLWKAVKNAIHLVKPNGLLLLSTYGHTPTYLKKKKTKENYNKANKYGKMNMVADYVMHLKSTIKTPKTWNDPKIRGVRPYHDIVNWLGGMPYVVAETKTLVPYCNKFGMQLIKRNDTASLACHQWLFQKRKLKMFVCCPQFPGNGGAATNAYAIIKYLRKLGHHVAGLFIDQIDGNPDPDKIGGVYKMKYTGYFEFNNNELAKVKDTLVKYLGDEPQIVFAKNYIAPYVSKKLFSSAYIIYCVSGINHFSYWHQKSSKMASAQDVLKNGPPNKVTIEYEIKSNTLSDLIVCNSLLCRQLFEKIYPDVKNKLFAQPVDTTECIGVNEQPPICEKLFDIVIICSNFDRSVKNGQFIIKLLENPIFDKYNKCIIGQNGKFFSNIKNVKVVGLIPNKQVLNYLAQSRVLIFPSLFDSNPNTVREAILSNCLPLVSNNIGFWERFPEYCVCNNYELNTWTEKATNLIDNYDEIIKTFKVNFDSFTLDKLLDHVVTTAIKS